MKIEIEVHNVAKKLPDFLPKPNQSFTKAVFVSADGKNWKQAYIQQAKVGRKLTPFWSTLGEYGISPREKYRFWCELPDLNEVK